MSLLRRIEKIAKELNSGDLFIRFGNSDGTYPEKEEDQRLNRKVLFVTINGCTKEEAEEWAK